VLLELMACYRPYIPHRIKMDTDANITSIAFNYFPEKEIILAIDPNEVDCREKHLKFTDIKNCVILVIFHSAIRLSDLSLDL
jgi:hypothetical protein